MFPVVTFLPQSCVPLLRALSLRLSEAAMFFRRPQAKLQPPETSCSSFQREKIHKRCKTICPMKDDVDAVTSIATNHGTKR